MAINAAGKPSNPPEMGPLTGKVPIPEKKTRQNIQKNIFFFEKNAI